jgi:putative transposase
MPWHGVSPMDLRLAFVREFRMGAVTMTELCDQFGVSRKTGYVWVGRFEADGRAGLYERSRRPHLSPRTTDPAIVEALCDARRAHPTWSARKLLAMLVRRYPAVPWPRRSTGCAWLKARGLVRARRRPAHRRAPSAPLGAVTHANDVWTTDFKGEFRVGDGRYCYPFTLRDAFSRYVLRCDALATKDGQITRRCFERAFAVYGLPERIRSDNGGPFAAPGLTRLSHLSAWWIRLGIVPERIALGHPEQNGSHEQFHRVLKAETTRPPAPNLLAQQQRFHRFRAEYNHDRPHEALRDQPPATAYARSPRPMPRHLPSVDYAGHLEVRRVSSCGTVSWKAHPLYISTVLAGQDGAFEEIDDGIWRVSFASIALARFDERTRTLTAVAHATR